jgi:hypothetical protein
MSDEFEYEEEQIEAPEVETEDVDVEEEVEVAGNPALSELYDVLPKSLHGLVEPVINKWQAGIDQQFEKIAPYRKYADAGVNPDVIEASLELAQEISSNPKAVYDELASRYGWQQAQQIMQDAVETAAAVEEDEDDDFADPTAKELKALKAEIEAMRTEREQEIEQKTEQAYESEIETTVAALKNEFGDFNEEVILRRAMVLAEEYPSAELFQLIGAAHEQYAQELKDMQASIRRAPRVAGGTNNAIPAPPAPKLNTREDRIAAIEEIAKRGIAGLS